MKHILYIITFLLSFPSSYLYSQPSNHSIDSIIHLITIDSYSSHFDSIRTNEFCSRKAIPSNKQSTDHDACRDYINKKFAEYLGDNNVYLHQFDSNEYQNLTNIIGVKHGKKTKADIWIIGAHYDSNNNMEPMPMNDSISPGANDNGTGVAAILEMARIIGSLETDVTIIFAAWDLEEIFTNGMATGSNEWYCTHVKKRKVTQFNPSNQQIIINKNNIRGYLNFDMIGNPQLTEDNKPILWTCYARNKHIGFVDDYSETLNKYVPEIKTVNYGRLTVSDHYTFASRKIPALENLESGYSLDPYYHTFSDNFENELNIDFEFATNVTRGGLAYLLEQLNCNTNKPKDKP